GGISEPCCNTPATLLRVNDAGHRLDGTPCRVIGYMGEKMTATSPQGIEDLFSDRATMARPGMVGSNPQGIADVIAFSGGYPDPGTLPVQDIIESTRIALERGGEWALQYAFGSGVPELVEQ